MQSDELTDFLMVMGAARTFKDCNISKFDVDARTSDMRYVLIACMELGDNTAHLNLWTFDELAKFGAEGYELISAKDKYHFLTEFAKGDYVYFN